MNVVNCTWKPSLSFHCLESSLTFCILNSQKKKYSFVIFFCSAFQTFSCLYHLIKFQIVFSQVVGRETRQRIRHHLLGRSLRVHRGLVGAPVGWDCQEPEVGRLSDHRRHLGRHLRVRHGFRHDVGRIQLETQFQMVSWKKIFTTN